MENYPSKSLKKVYTDFRRRAYWDLVRNMPQDLPAHKLEQLLELNQILYSDSFERSQTRDTTARWLNEEVMQSLAVDSRIINARLDARLKLQEETA